MTLRNLEEAGHRVDDEEACNNALQMAACLLANKVVRETVVAVESSHREQSDTPGGMRS